MSVDIADNPGASRYEIRVDGEVAGFARYERREGVTAFVHTEIDDRFEGQGLASKLIEHALDDSRRRDVHVEPICPFVRRYIGEHEEYQDLVAPERAPVRALIARPDSGDRFCAPGTGSVTSPRRLSLPISARARALDPR